MAKTEYTVNFTLLFQDYMVGFMGTCGNNREDKSQEKHPRLRVNCFLPIIPLVMMRCHGLGKHPRAIDWCQVCIETNGFIYGPSNLHKYIEVQMMN